MMDGLLPDKTTQALHKLLNQFEWQPVVGSPINGELYETRLYMQIEPGCGKDDREAKYIEAMLNFFREGVEKVEVAAMELIPNLYVMPDMHETIEDWTEKFIVSIVERRPAYEPYLEPESMAGQEFHGKKTVFVQTVFSIITHGEGLPPVLVWVCMADAYVCDMFSESGTHRFVRHIETEVER